MFQWLRLRPMQGGLNWSGNYIPQATMKTKHLKRCSQILKEYKMGKSTLLVLNRGHFPPEDMWQCQDILGCYNWELCYCI